MLWTIITFVLFIHGESIRIGKIENATLIGTVNKSFVNITLNECICTMIKSNGSISGLNYFQMNQTCQLFYDYIDPSNFKISFNSDFIFINQSFMSIQTMTTNQPIIYTSVSPSITRAFWAFDGDLNDEYSTYTGIPINNVAYYSPGITGYGSALRFNFSLNQSVLIGSTIGLNISFTSFTFELWIYPFSLSPNDRGMIGQCQSLTTNQCLHLTLRNSNVRISFYSNACAGVTTILPNTWYHLGFTYNYQTSTQMIYVNGILDCSHTSSAPLQITNSTPLTIGVTYPLAPFYYDGLIDQVSLVKWVKNASEILSDATLVAYYSFDNTSFDDSGPNGIDGIGVNAIFSNKSLLINNTISYFQASTFVLLGIDNRSYSFSLWINPLQTNGSTILHISQNSSGGGQWCSPFLGFNSLGQLVAQSRSSVGVLTVSGPYVSTHIWTHIAQTYSSSNGVSLYINGSLFNKSASIDYRSSRTPVIITLGSSIQYGNGTCINGAIQPGQYSGGIDEFRVYSRELTVADIQTLLVR